MKITLKPFGDVDSYVLHELQKLLGNSFGCPVEIGTTTDIPERAYRKGRGQYLASMMLDVLKAINTSQDERKLGVIDADLYAPGLNFVFGQADPDYGVAIISLCRLRQELPPDRKLFLDRTCKEAVHELGHTFGLVHCPKTRCVMHFSSSISDTDLKSMAFCSQCQPKLI
jgi:archaemetzincin